tara:strand:- start:396 stop:548 length:153 start_codon:yes stop_codon:yes gene_type:complete
MGETNYSRGGSPVPRNSAMVKAVTVILAMRDQTHYLMLAPSANNNRRDKD